MSIWSLQNNRRANPRKRNQKVPKELEGTVALKMVKKLKKELETDTEVKYVNTVISMVPNSISITQVPIIFPAQGVTKNQRIADSIGLTDIKMKLVLSSQPTESEPIAALAPNVTRILLIRNNDGYTASLTVGEVLELTAANDLTEYRNINFTKKYKVLYDNVYCLQRTGLAYQSANNYASLGTSMFIEYFKKFKKPQDIDFTAAGTAVNNQYWVVALSNGAANDIIIDGNVRISYTDV